MDSLSPTRPPTRHRASSTTVRPFASHSLGRRRSNSCLQQQQPAPTPAPTPGTLPEESITTAVHPPSMLAVFASRFLQWLRLQPQNQQHLSWSLPSSPRSSGEDFVLPLSASAAKTSFDASDIQHPQQQQQSPRWQILSQHAPIILVVLLLPLSTALVALSLYTLPISLAWPRTIADVAQLGNELHAYTQSGSRPVAHVMAVLAITAIWKHAWSIPGSVIWNVLAGALFSPAYATILLTTLTMLGSACATLLATPLAPFLAHFFPRALDLTRTALEGGSDEAEAESGKARSPAWVRLSVLRLIGVVPWSGINIACGVCGVSMADCLLGTFIGTLPWTAVTCQIGDILQTVASTPSPTPQSISSLLTTPDIILKLVFLSFLSLAPILGRDHLRTLISSPLPQEKPKWAWVQQWRTRLRSKSQIRAEQREQSLKQLAVLVQEKHALELPS